MVRWLCALACTVLLLLFARSAAAAYAHRWTWKSKPDPEAVAKWRADVRKIVEKRRAELEVSEPGTETEALRLDGKGSDAGQPFVFPGAVGAHIVDTDRKPYDAVVTAALIVARDCFSPDVLVVESDGDWVAWQDGRILYQEVLGRVPQNPGIREHAVGFHPGGRTVLPEGPSARDRFRDARTRPWGIVIALCIAGLIVLLLVPTKQE